MSDASPRRAAKPKGTCPYCHREIAIRKDGNLMMHQAPEGTFHRTPGGNCAGSYYVKPEAALR